MKLKEFQSKIQPVQLSCYTDSTFIMYAFSAFGDLCKIIAHDSNNKKERTQEIKSCIVRFVTAITSLHASRKPKQFHDLADFLPLEKKTVFEALKSLFVYSQMLDEPLELIHTVLEFSGLSYDEFYSALDELNKVGKDIIQTA